jgi:mercuric ion transport protein
MVAPTSFGTWRSGEHFDPLIITDCFSTVVDASAGRAQKLAAAGGILAAIAASSCCIVPLLLFSLGVSGAWIGNLTRLAPYQPIFVAVTLSFLSFGYWLVWRARRTVCAEGASCSRPLPRRSLWRRLSRSTPSPLSSSHGNRRRSHDKAAVRRRVGAISTTQHLSPPKSR